MFDFLEAMEPGLLHSLLIIVCSFFLRFVANSVVRRKVTSLRSRYVWRQTINVVLLAAALPALIITWFDEFRSVLTMLSLVAAALTVVCKELLINMAAYLVILWRAVFTMGDRIQVGVVTGDVINQGLMYINIAEVGNWAHSDGHTGRTVMVPNCKVLTEPVINFSRGQSLIWDETSFEFDQSSSYAELKKLGDELIESFGYKLTLPEKENIAHIPEEIMFSGVPVTYVELAAGKFVMTLRYLCKFHKRSFTRQVITDRLMENIDGRSDITLVKK